jgi:hypothetical protein
MYFRLKHHYQIKVITFDVVFIAIIPKTDGQIYLLGVMNELTIGLITELV